MGGSWLRDISCRSCFTALRPGLCLTRLANLANNISGAALPDWLLQGESKDVRDKFHPVPHMVPHLQREAYQRTVFARMMVAPSDAIPTRVKNPHPVTFEEVFMRQNRLEIQLPLIEPSQCAKYRDRQIHKPQVL